MLEFSWLAQEAKEIHLIFQSLFYSIITLLLMIGVFIEYFKFPVGGVPSFTTLLGRCFVAAIMLASFPEFLNLVGEVTDALSSRIGQLNEFKLVLAKMGDQLDNLTWSWTSVKKMTIVLISFLAFFALYVSVYVSEAIYFYAWTLLYIFSPICFALYVLPSTEGAAKGVYKSILQVASWKIIWSVFATLLWSAALADLDKLGNNVDFLTVILFNLMLAASLLFTPLISSMLFNGGFSQAAAKLGGAATGAAMYGASKLMQSPPVQKLSSSLSNAPRNTFDTAKSYMRARQDQNAINRNPSLTKTPEKLPSHIAERKQEQKEYARMDKAAIKKSPYLKHMPKSLPSSIARLEREEKKERLTQRRERLNKIKAKRKK